MTQLSLFGTPLGAPENGGRGTQIRPGAGVATRAAAGNRKPKAHAPRYKRRPPKVECRECARPMRTFRDGPICTQCIDRVEWIERMNERHGRAPEWRPRQLTVLPGTTFEDIFV